jgi:replication-associated recombination protein RarA
MNDIKAGKAGLVPPHLRDGHYSGAEALGVDGGAVGYQYSHDHPDGVVPQQYPPDELIGVDYYQPTNRAANARSAAGWADCAPSSAAGAVDQRGSAADENLYRRRGQPTLL